MSAINNESSFFFLIFTPFIYFPCLTVVVRAFSIRVNGSGESGHPLLSPVLGESVRYVTIRYDFN